MSRSRHVLFVDCETTGLTHQDRMVTLGAIMIDPEALADGEGARAIIGLHHLVFNPGRPSNPFAAAVHGYDDWTLSQQQDFADHAGSLVSIFAEAEAIHAHNASFDERFVRTGFAEAGYTLPVKRFSCTLRAWRAKHGSPAGLDAVIERLGLRKRGKEHGALDDALYCLKAFAALEGLGEIGEPDGFRALADQPSNWREPSGIKPIRGMRPPLRA